MEISTAPGPARKEWEETNFFPDRDGRLTLDDPTHGRVDRDIQWYVERMKPGSLGQRVAMEDSLQRTRITRRHAPRGRFA